MIENEEMSNENSFELNNSPVPQEPVQPTTPFPVENQQQIETTPFENMTPPVQPREEVKEQEPEIPEHIKTYIDTKIKEGIDEALKKKEMDERKEREFKGMLVDYVSKDTKATARIEQMLEQLLQQRRY